MAKRWGGYTEEDLAKIAAAAAQLDISGFDQATLKSMFERNNRNQGLGSALRGMMSGTPGSGPPPHDPYDPQVQVEETIANLYKHRLASEQKERELQKQRLEDLTREIDLVQRLSRLNDEERRKASEHYVRTGQKPGQDPTRPMGGPAGARQGFWNPGPSTGPTSYEEAQARNQGAPIGAPGGGGQDTLGRLQGQDYQPPFGFRAFTNKLRTTGQFDMDDLTRMGTYYLGIKKGEGEEGPPTWLKLLARTGAFPIALSAGIRGARYGISQARAGVTEPFNQLGQLFETFSGVNTTRAGQAAGFSGNVTQGPQGIFHNIRNTLSMGLGAGLDIFGLGGGKNGLFGFSGNDAMQEGFRRRLDAIKTGLNPFDALSIKQAQEIQDQVSGRGYTGRRAERVEDALERIVKSTSIEVGDALKIFDTVVKDLGADIDDTTDVIVTMGESARAAGKSLPLFFEEVAAGVDALRDAGAGTGSATSGSASDLMATAMQMAGVEDVPQSAIQGFLTGSMQGMLSNRIIQENPNMTMAERALVAQNPLAYKSGQPALQAGIGELRRVHDQLMASLGNEDLVYTELAKIFPELGNAGNVRKLLQADKSGQFSKPGMDVTGQQLKATLESDLGPKKLFGGITAPGSITRGMNSSVRNLVGRQIDAFIGSVQRRAGKDEDGNWIVNQSAKDEIRDRLLAGKTTVEEVMSQANRYAEERKSAHAVQVGLTEEARRLLKLMDQRPSTTKAPTLRQNLARNAGNPNDTTTSFFRD
jgi:hypothetical protein